MRLQVNQTVLFRKETDGREIILTKELMIRHVSLRLTSRGQLSDLLTNYLESDYQRPNTMVVV